MNSVHSSRSLFAYGTLMCPDIMYAVTGLRLVSEPAALGEYTRYRVAGEVYPALVPQKGARVEGTLYHDLPDTAWQRLDAFEGAVYERRLVVVEAAAGRRAPAYTYVWRPERPHDLTDEHWNYETFLRRDKAAFMRHECAGEA